MRGGWSEMGERKVALWYFLLYFKTAPVKMIMRRGGGWLEMEREDWTRGLLCQWCASHQVYPTYLYLIPDFPAVFFHIFHWYL